MMYALQEDGSRAFNPRSCSSGSIIATSSKESTACNADSQPDFTAHSPLETITSWFSGKKEEPPTAPVSGFDIHQLVSSSLHEIKSSPAAVAGLSAISATGLTLLSVVVYRKYIKRIRNADYVTSGMIQERKWIKGVVTSVGDGDNFRLFHTPAFYSWPLKLRKVPSEAKDLKDETIHIRIAGIDAPEAAHFGRPAQLHSRESLDWLRETLLKPSRKTMWCQILRKDQYGRIVAVPYIHRYILPNRPLPLEMLRNGMAEVYESGGAEYGPWGLERLKQIEAEAKFAKRGIWGINDFESPGEYKKRYRVGEDAAGAKNDGAAQQAAGGPGLWGWIRSWYRR